MRQSISKLRSRLVIALRVEESKLLLLFCYFLKETLKINYHF